VLAPVGRYTDAFLGRLVQDFLQKPGYLAIDLSKLEPHVVGPHTPDLARPVSAMKQAVIDEGYPAVLSSALVGSCTNSSYEDIGRAAHVARQATAAGLRVKTPLLITPGSEQVREHVVVEHDVEGGVRLRQPARVAEFRRHAFQRGRVLDVHRHRVHDVYAIPERGEPLRVHTGRAADVQDRRGRRRQMREQDLFRPFELEHSRAGMQPGPLDAPGVVLDETRIDRHAATTDARA
jgi:hypothetical protein